MNFTVEDDTIFDAVDGIELDSVNNVPEFREEDFGDKYSKNFDSIINWGKYWGLENEEVVEILNIMNATAIEPLTLESVISGQEFKRVLDSYSQRDTLTEVGERGGLFGLAGKGVKFLKDAIFGKEISQDCDNVWTALNFAIGQARLSPAGVWYHLNKKSSDRKKITHAIFLKGTIAGKDKYFIGFNENSLDVSKKTTYDLYDCPRAKGLFQGLVTQSSNNVKDFCAKIDTSSLKIGSNVKITAGLFTMGETAQVIMEQAMTETDFQVTVGDLKFAKPEAVITNATEIDGEVAAIFNTGLPGSTNEDAITDEPLSAEDAKALAKSLGTRVGFSDSAKSKEKLNPVQAVEEFGEEESSSKEDSEKEETSHDSEEEIKEKSVSEEPEEEEDEVVVVAQALDDFLKGKREGMDPSESRKIRRPAWNALRKDKGANITPTDVLEELEVDPTDDDYKSIVDTLKYWYKKCGCEWEEIDESRLEGEGAEIDSTSMATLVKLVKMMAQKMGVELPKDEIQLAAKTANEDITSLSDKKAPKDVEDFLAEIVAAIQNVAGKNVKVDPKDVEEFATEAEDKMGDQVSELQKALEDARKEASEAKESFFALSNATEEQQKAYDEMVNAYGLNQEKLQSAVAQLEISKKQQADLQLALVNAYEEGKTKEEALNEVLGNLKGDLAKKQDEIRAAYANAFKMKADIKNAREGFETSKSLKKIIDLAAKKVEKGIPEGKAVDQAIQQMKEKGLLKDGDEKQLLKMKSKIVTGLKNDEDAEEIAKSLKAEADEAGKDFVQKAIEALNSDGGKTEKYAPDFEREYLSDGANWLDTSEDFTDEESFNAMLEKDPIEDESAAVTAMKFKKGKFSKEGALKLMRSVADRMENAPESAPDWPTFEPTSKADMTKALRSVGLIEALQKKGGKLARYATHLYEDGRM